MGDLEQTIKSICDDIDACQAVMRDMQDELDAAISTNLAAVAALREANSTARGL